jgi:UDP-N-acetylglucosamine--N-acetylmuramyl-(pentapeptide) pyrophosphoryl-undecaprenol N-acetylglucosamine transferase
LAPKVLIATGGTGGHVFPALVCAEEFLKRGWEVCFVGSGREIEKNLLSFAPYRVLQVKPLTGKGIMGTVKGLLALVFALPKGIALLRLIKPNLVLGFGSYVSGPVILASALLRIPRAIHEQNVVPGLANRLSAPFAQKIFVSFEESLSYFPKFKTELTGNPIRQELIEEARKEERKMPFTVFVLGGSQGSSALNRVVFEVLKVLKDKIKIVHQTGKMDYEWLKEEYGKMGVEGWVFPFDNSIGRWYGKAHLVVSRAGALTLAEIACVGRASILVPYPYSTSNHQLKNAEVFVKHGASRMILQEELTPERLIENLEELMMREGLRVEMEKRAFSLGKPQASQMIVERSLELVACTAGR